MEFIVLRARAICASCHSRLPPRMQAWHDAESKTTWCETCGRYELQERAMEAQRQGATEAVLDAVTSVVVSEVVPPGAVADPPVDPGPGDVDLPEAGAAEANPTELGATEIGPTETSEAVAVEADPPEPKPVETEPAEPDPAVVETEPALVEPAVFEPEPEPVVVQPAAATTAEAEPQETDDGDAGDVGDQPASDAAAPGEAAADGVPASREAPGRSAPPEVHHDPPPPARLDEADEVDERRVRSVTSLLGRLRPAAAATPAGEGPPAREEWPFERVMAAEVEPVLDPEMTLPLERGDAGEGRVGQTLEAARIHGLEVLHGLRIDPSVVAIDHLVVSANGVWVISGVPVLGGPLERRDVGDWFTADPRLHIGGEDHSSLVATVRSQVEAVSAIMVRSSFSDVPVRGVLCFGSVQPGWVKEPFVIDGISVTWRRHVVEPLLEPVLLDLRTRTALVHALAGSVVAEDGGPAPARSDERPAASKRTAAG